MFNNSNNNENYGRMIVFVSSNAKEKKRAKCKSEIGFEHERSGRAAKTAKNRGGLLSACLFFVSPFTLAPFSCCTPNYVHGNSKSHACVLVGCGYFVQPNYKWKWNAWRIFSRFRSRLAMLLIQIFKHANDRYHYDPKNCNSYDVSFCCSF